MGGYAGGAKVSNGVSADFEGVRVVQNCPAPAPSLLRAETADGDSLFEEISRTINVWQS